MTCTCDTYEIPGPDGTLLTGERRRDPDCRLHGFPTDKWPASHPLYRHCRLVVLETGEVIGRTEASRRYAERENHWWGYGQMFREETPRETEARLYAESLAF